MILDHVTFTMKVLSWSFAHAKNRENNLDPEDWTAVMQGLEGCSRLTALNGIRCEGLLSGGLVKLDLTCQEPGFAVSLAPYLPCSASTLTSLKIRFVMLYCAVQILFVFGMEFTGHNSSMHLRPNSKFSGKQTGQ